MAKKTSTITFRIDEKYEKSLRTEAEEKRISLNTLANQIFGEYVEFGHFMKKFGMIEMSKGSFKELLDAIDEKNIIDFAKSIGSKEPKDFILFKWTELSPRTISAFIRIGSASGKIVLLTLFAKQDRFLRAVMAILQPSASRCSHS